MSINLTHAGDIFCDQCHKFLGRIVYDSNVSGEIERSTIRCRQCGATPDKPEAELAVNNNKKHTPLDEGHPW